jgi:hypothetical protein
VGVSACDSGSAPTLDRETFIQVYVELRIAALTQDDATLTDEDREQILAGHGITEEDLFAFADEHGDDPAYMVQVWEEIEERLNEDPEAEAEADSLR